MNGWLLDTNIVSQFAPAADGGVRANSDLAEWVEQTQEVLFLSVISVVEITAGIEKLRRAGSARRAEALDEWLGGILRYYGERILPIDTRIGMLAGVLTEQARADGHHPGLSDIMIAATTSFHGHGLLTQNLRHFEPLGIGIALHNPIAQTPPRWKP